MKHCVLSTPEIKEQVCQGIDSIAIYRCDDVGHAFYLVLKYEVIH